MKYCVYPTDKIQGEIDIDGSKNAALPLLAATLLTKEEITLKNVPRISDVFLMEQILKQIGTEILVTNNTVVLKRHKKLNSNLSELTKKLRASSYFLGALFSETNKFSTFYPGGCQFEKRPIDYHLDSLKQMGAFLYNKEEKIIIKRKRKHSAIIRLKKKSLGCTITILLASVKTKGTTIIYNASTEPEVITTIKLLKQMGAVIYQEFDRIEIIGVKELKGTIFEIPFDRIEAGSYMLLAAAAPKCDLILNNVDSSYLTSVIEKIRKLKVNVKIQKNKIRIIKDSSIEKGISIVAEDYPGFPTDLQQIASCTLLNANSPSIITDKIYKKRYAQLNQLKSIGASFLILDSSLFIYKSFIKGGEVLAEDLRGGFALIVAGINSTNKLIINNAEVINRGYANIVEKMKKINIRLEEKINK